MLISDNRVHVFFFLNLGIKVQLTVKVEIMHALPPTLSFWSAMSGHRGLKIKKKHDCIFNMYTWMLSF